MKFRVRHYTEYSYQDAVSTCYNRLCLTPWTMPLHECLSSELSVVPKPDELAFRTDFFGNKLAFFSVYKEHMRLRINANSVINIQERSPADLSLVIYETWRNSLQSLSVRSVYSHEIAQYILPSFYVPYSEVIRDFATECFTEDATLWTACNFLMQKIHKTIEFKPGFTTVNTPVEAVIRIKKGVCQDLAHLMIACLRNMGVPARYVSGYIETIPPPGKEKMVGADASHAWVSIYFPQFGWVEFDPTNNLHPSDKHIVTAYGRDYYDVAPIKGIVFNSGEQTLVVKVDVERISNGSKSDNSLIISS